MAVVLEVFGYTGMTELGLMGAAELTVVVVWVMVVERTVLVDSVVVMEGMVVVVVEEAVRPNNLNIIVKNFKIHFGSTLHIINI
jgi:hypothetical protein